MLPREDFIFTIGYDGMAAVVDKRAKSTYGKLSTRELAEKGLWRPAYSSAVYSGNDEERKFVVEAYQRAMPDTSTAGFTAPERLFGVIPVDVKRSISL